MYQFKTALVGAAVALGVLASAAVSQAATVFDFTYSGDGYSGSGQFISNDTVSSYYITDVTGVANGSAITGLSNYAGASNLLTFPGLPSTDQGGISFVTASGVMFNLFTQGSAAEYVLSSAVDSVGYASNGVPIILSISAVPEPAVWAMMLVGFGGLGVAMRSRRQSALAL
jgi:hypothetical protein